MHSEPFLELQLMAMAKRFDAGAVESTDRTKSTGDTDGAGLGTYVGSGVGTPVGTPVGSGEIVGAGEGAGVGAGVGIWLGAGVGIWEGAGEVLGAGVGIHVPSYVPLSTGVSTQPGCESPSPSRP